MPIPYGRTSLLIWEYKTLFFLDGENAFTAVFESVISDKVSYAFRRTQITVNAMFVNMSIISCKITKKTYSRHQNYMDFLEMFRIIILQLVNNILSINIVKYYNLK